MGFTLNEVKLIGNLGKDAEHRETQGGTMVTNFSIATTFSRKVGENKYEDETTWHSIVMFNLSDFHRQQLYKGSTVFVSGRLSLNEWTDSDGNKKSRTQIIGDKNSLIIFPKGSRGNSESHSDAVSADSTPPPTDSDMLIENNDDLPF